MKPKLFITAIFSLCVLSFFIPYGLIAQSETHDFITKDTTVVFSGVGSWNIRISRPANMFTPNHPDTVSRPAIVFMVGLGEACDCPDKLTYYGPHYLLDYTVNGSHHSGAWNGGVQLGNGVHYPIIISVQPHIGGPTARSVGLLILHLLNYYHIKQNSLHLTGLSMGAYSWTLAVGAEQSVGDETYMKHIRSITSLQGFSNAFGYYWDKNPETGEHWTRYMLGGDIPVLGGSTDSTLPAFIAYGYWAHKYGGKYFGLQGTADNRGVHLPAYAMNDSVSGSAYFSWENIGSGQHCCWNTMYDTAENHWNSVTTPLGPHNTTFGGYPNLQGNYHDGDFIFRWMLKQGDTSLIGASTRPTANAGSPQTITLPTSQVTLSGSGTANNGGSITSHVWTKFSGGSATITDNTNYGTTVTGLSEGTYVFRLTVIQDDSQRDSSNVTIIVNPVPPPTANAGSPQTITLPTSQVTLSGSGTANNGGSITSHVWTKFSGGSATITNSSNYTTTVTGLSAGTYVFRLTVTQDDSQTATSNVTITVLDSSDGKTIPGKIEAEDWDDKSGGMYAVSTGDTGGGQHVVGIANSNWLDYDVNVTHSGIYTVNFRIATTQNNAQFQIKSGSTVLGTINIPNTGGWDVWQTASVDSISLTAGTQTIRLLSTSSESCNFNWTNWVLVSSSTAPDAVAGSPQTITLPTSQVTLSGSGTANNGGSISSHVWTKFSGGSATITNSSNYTTTVTGLSAGTYVFRLTIIQDDSQRDSSDVTITVLDSTDGKTIPGKIETEDWDDKSGGMYAVSTGDTGGGQHVVGIANTNWLDYDVNVTQSGIYTVNFRIATTQNNAQFQIKSGSTVLGTINIPNTGGWDVWQTASVDSISLTAGTQTIRLLSTSSESCNFNWTNWVFVSSPGITENKAPVMEAPVQRETTAKSLALSVFPNPAPSYFNLKVQSKSRELVTIRVIDIAGRQVQQIQGIPGQVLKFGDHIGKGIYLVEVQQGSEKVVARIVKQ